MDYWVVFVVGMLVGVLAAVVTAAIYSYNADKNKSERQFEYGSELAEDHDIHRDKTSDELVSELVDQVNVLTDAFRSLNHDVSHLYDLFEGDDESVTEDPMEVPQVAPITIYPGEVLSDEEAQMLGSILKEHIDRRKSTTGI